METTLKELLGYDEETGAYARPNLLRRFAQAAIAFDRGISNQELADKLGTTREYVRLYFQGHAYLGVKRGADAKDFNQINLRRSSSARAHRRRARLRSVAKCRRFEDSVERALEQISRERDLSPPQVIGTPEETYIQREVITRDLMKALHQTTRTKEAI